MKRLFSFLFALATFAVLTVSCRHEVVRDDVKALVDEINESVLVGKIDGTKVKFDIREATFTHGAVMYGDSVIINYIGDLSMKRALAKTVFLLERKGNIIEIPREPEKRDTVKKLMTKPADSKQLEESRRAVNAAKYYAK